MSLINKLSSLLSFGEKEEVLEYYFALNIATEKLTAALWTIEGKHLKILETTSEDYSSLDEITNIADKLLDSCLGIREIDVQKILFGIPSTWLTDDNLKDEYLKILRKLVKELELSPMAYVATSNALVHFLEKLEGVPTTAILAGFEEHYLTTTVARAGKLDGVKIIQRGDSSGVDLEKTLLTFSSVETLPSKILIYDSNSNLEKLKNQLLSFSWMSKLSFLHLPKIEILGADLEIKSVCLAGASEINPAVSYTDQPLKKEVEKPVLIEEEEAAAEQEQDQKQEVGGNFGFMVGDVSSKTEKESDDKEPVAPEESNLLEIDDFERELESVEPIIEEKPKYQFNLKKFIPKKIVKSPLILGIMIALTAVLAAYLFIPKAHVRIFVEPRVLEKDAQVIADPAQKTVDENAKIIPGQEVSTEISGSSKDIASGKKEVGDLAKGTVVLRNKTEALVSLSKGTILTSTNGQKFSLDLSVNIASRSADDGTWGKGTTTVTSGSFGADGNLASGTDLTVAGLGTDKVVAKSEGNFSGGTSKQVTVVSSDDQKRLLAKLSSDLRGQAQQKLQDKLQSKKILEEALSETILTKSYSKNINDQASEFSLNMSSRYKGTAFDDKDLRLIVSNLVTTQVPDGFLLDLGNTETQADVSNVDKNGKVVFLAKFKAKLIPKLDSEKIKNQIRGKSVAGAVNTIKGMDNVLGSEIKFNPSLPIFLQRLPILTKNIIVEVGLK